MRWSGGADEVNVSGSVVAECRTAIPFDSQTTSTQKDFRNE
jgi:hypothetical protein